MNVSIYKSLHNWSIIYQNLFILGHTPIYHPVKIKIEGAFGGGNQDWYKYEIAVMIGGGIGVTPYSSILNDLVFGTSTNRLEFRKSI